MNTRQITLSINGKEELLELKPWVTLLDCLRERLDLTGTKKVATTVNAVLVPLS